MVPDSLITVGGLTLGPMHARDAGGVWAVLTWERPGSSLGGLGGVLSSRRKRRLAQAIIRDVVEAVRDSRVVDEVLLASGDATVHRLALRAGLPSAVKEGGDWPSLPEAIDTAVGREAEVLVLLRGDLPLLEAQDVAFLVGRVRRGPRVVLLSAPDSAQVSLACANPAEAVVPETDASVTRWQAVARKRGIPWEVYRTAAGLRPSSPEDLLTIYEASHASRAKALLKEWRMGPMLRSGEGVHS